MEHAQQLTQRQFPLYYRWSPVSETNWIKVSSLLLPTVLKLNCEMKVLQTVVRHKKKVSMKYGYRIFTTAFFGLTAMDDVT
jgi:hypothetical protein